MTEVHIDVDDEAVLSALGRACEAADDLAVRLEAARPKWVRVRDTSGHEISVRADVPEGHPRGVQPGMTVLDKPATDLNGNPRRPKLRLPLGTALPGGRVDLRRQQNRTTPTETSPADPDGQQAAHEQEN